VNEFANDNGDLTETLRRRGRVRSGRRLLAGAGPRSPKPHRTPLAVAHRRYDLAAMGEADPPRRRLDRRALLTLAGAGLAGWAGGRVLSRTVPVGRDVSASGAVSAILDDDEAPASGPAGAGLRLAVFSDYRCPACRHAFPALQAALAADGDVRVLYKDWPIFGAPSERAARVALASAAQGIYASVHQRLMTAAGTFDEPMLRDAVRGAGGDWARLLADLASGRDRIDAQLRRHGAEARAIGLPGTPGYLAGPLLVLGAIDAADFARLFARARTMTARRATGS
jgi:protein-disulfide isomerase